MNRHLKNLHFSKFTYISECMIIKAEHMKNFITQKEKNTEKIIISIDKSEITKSGFSEFENYGVYADNNNIHFYKLKQYSSQREIVKFYSKLYFSMMMFLFYY